MSTDESPFPPADWQALQLTVDRCYEGIPCGLSGTYPGTVFTLCQLQRGSLEMSHDDIAIHTDATERPWILNIPGERTQHFSDDPDIISVHLCLSNPCNGAEWRGKPLVVAIPDEPARQALHQLQRAVTAAGIPPRQLDIRGLPMELPAALCVHAAASSLFAHLLRLALPLGMRYEVPPIRDPRVRDSHLCVATMAMQARFSREQLASEQGLTPGQLDRLWRQELGLTPQQYRDNRRFAYACEQLRRRAVSVKEIAADLGFRHLSQFSNWFRARHNESPRSYRNRPYA
ncbi:helix-turn-helix transcriptional regulator [Ruficoccus sp. ZRK36]|uniref:helix-turn-helix domain-containing protein n=1 Tax=Ruficoccus sp. ZRK36 TaxID=2866311 RepID=UPI001C73AAEF|nr:helix-turn-helix transcriptional regulator [Ruficoccus sp. ZRK36]QYY37230.1 helix-turn-helix transcriptional regulator [Ruficoccus sp. ZRK36]